MFGIAWNEYIVIAVVALIVIGPKELPRVLRTIGQWTTKIRRMAAEFQGQFQEALREAEMADLKKEVDNLNEQARGFTSQFNDPLNFEEATKWEPKTEPALEPKPEISKSDDVEKPIESSSAPRMSDAPAAAGPAPAVEHVQPVVEHPATEAAAAHGAAGTAPVPEGSGPKAEEGVHS